MGKFIQLGGSKDPIGYCHYHKFTISKQQLKSKQCIEKNCNRLQKYSDHPFWINKEKQKQLAKQHREEKKIKQKEEFKKMEKKNLIKAITYCHNCPKSKKESLEYCSQCPYAKDCMSEIIDLIYEYFKKYENETFEEFLCDDKILVNKFAYNKLIQDSNYTSTK